MRGNFVDLPTDCPQRDERLGWTGDLQVFAPTASFLFDTAGMLRSWLADLAVEQLEDHDGDRADVRAVPPAQLPFPPLQADVGWGDAAVVVPWVLYERTGDAGLLADQWDVDDHLDRRVRGARRRGPGLPGGRVHRSATGWTPPRRRTTPAPRGRRGSASRPPTSPGRRAWWRRRPRCSAGTARRFADLAERAAARFRAEYVTPNGRLAFPSQTAYALALEFDLLTAEQREHAGRLLAEQVLKDGFHIASGFLGTPLVTDALTNAGELATAYELLLQRENPSWLYPVTMGATTIWERWDSMLPDGSINPGDMTSFNHYAFGAVADWLHRTVAGLAPAAPGYRRLRIAPRPGRA